jgi:hypothetical protein
VAHKGFDCGPVHEARRVTAASGDPPAEPARSGIDTGDDPAGIAESQLDVVRHHEAARFDTDEPAAEHVVAEEHLPLPALEMREVQILTCKLDGTLSQLGNPVSGDEELTTRNPGHQAGDGWVATFRKTGNDVINTAEPSTRSINERASQNPGESEPARLASRLPGV